MAKKEDPKPSHQLYKLQIKSTQSTRQTLCLWNIQNDIESSHKGKCISSDSCGPAMGTTQILIWSYTCVFLPPMSTALRASAFYFVGALNGLLYILSTQDLLS